MLIWKENIMAIFLLVLICGVISAFVIYSYVFPLIIAKIILTALLQIVE